MFRFKDVGWIAGFFICSVVLTIVSSADSYDVTIKPLATGAAVVESVCLRIESSCIFTEDKLLTRRMAYVESADGLDPKTFRANYYGGIWQASLLIDIIDH